MPDKEVIIEFDEEGGAEVSVKGVPGKTCTELTRELEDALGVVHTRELTPEFRQAPVKNTVQARR